MTDTTRPFKEIWHERTGTDIDAPAVDVFRPVTSDNVAYLVNQYPFVQILNTEAIFIGEVTPEFTTSNSGWTIHSYGDALASSPGEYLYGGGDYEAFTKRMLRRLEAAATGKKLEDDDEGGEGAPMANPGKGTIINQTFLTAYDMISMALQKAWAGIKIIDGSPLMKWAVWAIAKNHGLTVEGYDPSEKDEERRERVAHIAVLPPNTTIEYIIS